MQRPWISTNLAISADGKITSAGRLPSHWTSAADKERLLSLRTGADALMVGRGTLVADRMSMVVPDKSVQPLRCVVSSGAGGIPRDHPLLESRGGAIHWLVTGSPDFPLPDGMTVHRSSIMFFLHSLASDHGVRHLHCEGGGCLIRALASLDVIDEFHATLAGHVIFGGTKAPAATGISADFLPNSVGFQLSCFEPRSDLGECFVSYSRKPQSTQLREAKASKQNSWPSGHI